LLTTGVSSRGTGAAGDSGACGSDESLLISIALATGTALIAAIGAIIFGAGLPVNMSIDSSASKVVAPAKRAIGVTAPCKIKNAGVPSRNIDQTMSLETDTIWGAVDVA
jgi:hypothetical protein